MFSSVKLPVLALCAPLLLGGGGSFAQTPAPVSTPVPIWTLSLSLQDNGSPLRRDLIAQLRELCTESKWNEYVQKIQRVEVAELPHGEEGKKDPMVACFQFPDGTPAEFIAKLAAEPGVETESIDGVQVLKVTPAKGSTKGECQWWVAQRGGEQLVVTSSRSAMQLALAQVQLVSPATKDPSQLLSVNLDLDRVGGEVQRKFEASGSPSDLSKYATLAKLGKQLAISVETEGEHVRVNGLVQCNDDRSAKRSRLVLEGLLAALADSTATNERSLDDYIKITNDSDTLNIAVDLTDKEIKDLIRDVQTMVREHDAVSPARPKAR